MSELTPCTPVIVAKDMEAVIVKIVGKMAVVRYPDKSEAMVDLKMIKKAGV